MMARILNLGWQSNYKSKAVEFEEIRLKLLPAAAWDNQHRGNFVQTAIAGCE